MRWDASWTRSRRRARLMPTPDFTDRVMAAVAAEPPPRPVAAFGAAVMAVSLRRTLTAIGDAWRVALSGARPPAIRAQALALVLVVAIGTLGVGSAAVAGASALFAPAPSVAPPSPAPSTVAPTPDRVSPTPSVTPSPTMTGSRPTRRSRPRPRARPTTTAATPDRAAEAAAGVRR